jgi:hypothetical protein
VNSNNMDRSLLGTTVGIRFGNYLFSDPVPMGRFSFLPRSAGLYVVLMPDLSWGPWPFQPLFFGEFGVQREALMTQAQQAYCLKVAAGRILYVAVYALPEQHGWTRSQIKKELIERYRPVSNLESIDTAAELRYRLDSLEKRILEQNAALQLALAAIGQTIQLQPGPKKRILGFQPNPADSRRGSPAKTQTTF